MMCAEDGVLLPLNDLIDEYGPNLKQKWEENPAFVEYMTAPDGNVYTFFDADTGTHLLAENKMFVYKPWLDKLGLDVPETTEDFKKMLIAFQMCIRDRYGYDSSFWPAQKLWRAEGIAGD